MNAEEARGMMGQRLHRVRRAQGKSLDVVAGAAGISTGYLSMLETGERALGSVTLIVALANALGIAPSDLTRMPVPAPGNGNTDGGIAAIRLALDSVELGQPDGAVLPAEVLRQRVEQIHQKSRGCQFTDVTAALPGLIRDLHTTLNTGTDRAELLALGVLVHVHITRRWLGYAAAPTDLRRRAVFLARTLAHDHGESPIVGTAAFGVADVLLRDGSFDVAREELNSLTPPSATADTAGLLCALMASHALAATVTGHPTDTAAPMETAADIAAHFGEFPEDPLGFAFGPMNVGFRQMDLALERDDPEETVRIAEALHPERHPFSSQRVYYWITYGRALARLRGRRDDTVRALRTAEETFPMRVYRDPMVRETLTVLIEKPPKGRAGEELRGLARRAGLSV